MNLSCDDCGFVRSKFGIGMLLVMNGIVATEISTDAHYHSQTLLVRVSGFELKKITVIALQHCSSY